MNEQDNHRPVSVKLAAVVFLLGFGLLFFDAVRYQLIVSPDYFSLFWGILVPMYLVGIAVGFLGLWSRRRFTAALAPLILSYFVYRAIPDPNPPPAWPAVVPLWVYLILIGLLVALVLSPSSVRWYWRRGN